MTAATPAVPAAVELCHQLLRWMIPVLDRVPKSRRYTLALHLEQHLLGVLDHLVSASFQTDKRLQLMEANRRLSVARHLWRLCLELNLVALPRHQHGAELMVNLGKQIGGWQRYSKS